MKSSIYWILFGFYVVSHSGLSVISSSSKPVDSSKHRWNLNPIQFPMTISAVVWIIISPKKIEIKLHISTYG